MNAVLQPLAPPVELDSAAAGLRGPIDRVWPDVRDLAGLTGDCVVRRSP